jgi:hypothetical protein
VKYWTSILAAAAIMALGAPAAFAAGTTLPWEPAVGPTHLVTHTGVQNLSGHKTSPASQITVLRAKNKALTAKAKAMAAKAKAAAAEAKWQADRNLALANYIGELNNQLMQYRGTPAVTPDDPDKDCKDYSVCTPEQDCRLNGNNCPVTPPPAPPVDEVKQDDGAGAGAQAMAQSLTYVDTSELYQDC